MANPLGEPLAVIYLIARAWGREIDEQVERIGAFSSLYLLAADLIDDVQDGDLEGKPHALAGPAVALNNGVALLFLALRELRHAIELETDEDRARAYLRLLNRVSLAAVAGQHRDLTGEQGARSPAEVLEMQEVKTSSFSLITECGGLLAGCGPEDLERYRRIGENLAMLIQVRDDLRDIYGKRTSPDLVNAKITYPVACFLETADPTRLARFEMLQKNLPGTMPKIRELLYDSKAVERSADAIQLCREAVHRDVAATGNRSAFHRTLLDLVDRVAGSVYEPPPVEETKSSWQPPGRWHERVRESLEAFYEHMHPFGVPASPALRPWHLPQWLYDKDKKTIFYPDIEGLAEEILPFQAELLGMDDREQVEALMYTQVPVVLAHELFHYFRDASGRLTGDHWHEEWAANRLAVAYALRFVPHVVDTTYQLAETVMTRHEHRVDALVNQILDNCTEPHPDPRGYGMDVKAIAVTTAEMFRRTILEKPELTESMTELLGWAPPP
jgi:geranylgeranyl pyrophosphate synthase